MACFWMSHVSPCYSQNVRETSYLLLGYFTIFPIYNSHSKGIIFTLSHKEMHWHKGPVSQPCEFLECILIQDSFSADWISRWHLSIWTWQVEETTTDSCSAHRHNMKWHTLHTLQITVVPVPANYEIMLLCCLLLSASLDYSCISFFVVGEGTERALSLETNYPVGLQHGPAVPE